MFELIGDGINKIVAAMLTQAWASTKKRDVSQEEIINVFVNFLK